jgi:hypothetical protein
VTRPLLRGFRRSSGEPLTRVYRPRCEGYVRLDNGAKGLLHVAGISLGGLIVIIGIILAIVWSPLWGIIIALIGLIAFGGFARGRWY